MKGFDVLSVIILYSTGHDAYMASDSQSTNIKSEEIGSPTKKIIKPNNNILIGGSGYALIVRDVLNMFLTTPDDFYVMDAFNKITRFIQDRIHGNPPVPTTILLAGKDNTGLFNKDLVSYNITIGKAPIQYTGVTKVVLPPPDEKWNGLERLERYLETNNVKESMEQLVNDYSTDSKYVGGSFQFESIHT